MCSEGVSSGKFLQAAVLKRGLAHHPVSSSGEWGAFCPQELSEQRARAPSLPSGTVDCVPFFVYVVKYT